jgi:hypothetical protein
MLFDFTGKRNLRMGDSRADNEKERGGLTALFSLLDDLSNLGGGVPEVDDWHR